MHLSEAIANRGFHHQKNFFTDDEAEKIRRLYDRTGGTSSKKKPIVGVPLSAIEDSIKSKLVQLQKDCFPHKELILHKACFFCVFREDVSGSVNFDFHQDNESFYVFQEHFYYLNFYIPVEKEDTENSNLTLIPFDVLEERDSKMHRAVIGSGATVFEHGSFINENLGSGYSYDFDLQDIAVTPKLNVGDLLLMRGDIIHKTQNQASNRIAISFRAVDKQAVCNNPFNPTFPSRAKLSLINQDAFGYSYIDYIYAKEKVDYFTAEELLNRIWALDEIVLIQQKKPLDLVLHLLRFKLKVWLRLILCRIW